MRESWKKGNMNTSDSAPRKVGYELGNGIAHRVTAAITRYDGITYGK